MEILFINLLFILITHLYLLCLLQCLLPFLYHCIYSNIFIPTLLLQHLYSNAFYSNTFILMPLFQRFLFQCLYSNVFIPMPLFQRFLFQYLYSNAFIPTLFIPMPLFQRFLFQCFYSNAFYSNVFPTILFPLSYCVIFYKGYSPVEKFGWVDCHVVSINASSSQTASSLNIKVSRPEKAKAPLSILTSFCCGGSSFRFTQ